MKSQECQEVPKIKVYVGMSGGVDSSVSALLLKQAGYDVTGVFIKVWQPDWITCNWKEERIEAMRAAAHIGIPFVTLDLVQEYKTEVIDYMIAEYKAGRTPNPDVMCNREVKFGAFWRWAYAQGADFVATGHYARVEKHALDSLPSGRASKPAGFVLCSRRRAAQCPSVNKSSACFDLLTGIDANKDQSYFLWTLNQNDLEHIMFPIGHLTKPEVRALAKKHKLPNAEKKDSQGLCFIGKIDVKEFLSHYIHTEKGNVLNEKGEIIGTHEGALLLTIGERHGFTITKKTPHDTPYYILRKDIANNTIIVGQKISETRSSATGTQKINLERVNWTGLIPAIGSKLQARTRYRQPLQGITILSINEDTVVVECEHVQDVVAPGQSLVIYNGEQCIGGGIIS
ncbi:MAG: tRNA 2-thiouridine(34) synthase MnmA [Candidatus Taylorbacteria bacterium]